MRRAGVIHLLLAGYCLGLCLSLVWRPGPLVLAAGCVVGAGGALGAAALGRRRSGASRQASATAAADTSATHVMRTVIAGCVLALFLVCGVAVGSLRLAHFEHSRLTGFIGRRATLRGTVTGLPKAGPGKLTVPLRVDSASGAPVHEPAHLTLSVADNATPVYDPCGVLTEGAQICIAGVSISAPPATQPGQFDYGRYLRRRGEHVMLTASLADLHIVGHRGGLQGWVDRLRVAARRHLRRGLAAPVREVLDGMVLGDDQGVDDGLIEDFRRSGLLHILAVSGENVVLLCSMWTFVLMLLGVGRVPRTLALLPLVVTYVMVTGASPSIVRAGVAGVIGLLATLVSRPSDGWLLWLAPAAWLLSVNPNTLTDVSFQLSFAAVAGLLLLATPLARRLSFLPAPVASQVSVTTAASLATAPVSMLTFGSTSAVGVLANVAGGFVLGPIMFLGMLSVVAGFFWGRLCTLLNVLAGLFTAFLIWVARAFGNLSFAVLEWHGPTLSILVPAALVAELLVVWRLAERRRLTLREFAYDDRRRGHLCLATAALLAAVLVLTPAAASPPRVPTVTCLDIGEGAAALVQAPGGPTVLIDAGPSPLAHTLRAHGVRRIDLLVLSHGHADHVAGLQDVIGSIPITRALLPRPPTPSPALERIRQQLTAAGTDVRDCTSPLALKAGAVSLLVLPTHANGEAGNQGENDCALVVVVGFGEARVLLPGDCEGAALAALSLPPVTVAELPHHGSRDGFDTALLARLEPRLGVISVGPNTYGHPTAQMLTLMAAAGVPVLRTDQAGDVVLSADPNGLRVACEPPR